MESTLHVTGIKRVKDTNFNILVGVINGNHKSLKRKVNLEVCPCLGTFFLNLRCFSWVVTNMAHSFVMIGEDFSSVGGWGPEFVYVASSRGFLASLEDLMALEL
ncbi:hypothetical protein CR513_38943, partial [Mucuna pruriens]